MFHLATAGESRVLQNFGGPWSGVEIGSILCTELKKPPQVERRYNAKFPGKFDALSYVSAKPVLVSHNITSGKSNPQMRGHRIFKPLPLNDLKNCHLCAADH